MATKTLNTLLNGSFAELEAHLSAYLGDWPDELSDGEFSAVDGQSFSLNLANAPILNGQSEMNAYLVKNGPDDFIFCLTVRPAPKNFAEFFPQMLPFDPWGVLDVTTLPFPNLSVTKVEDIQWVYIYMSSGDPTSLTKLKANFKKEWLSHFPFGSQTKDQIFNTLAGISKSDKPLDDTGQWKGGLYYFGQFGILPFEDIFPAGPPWDIGRNNLAVRGCIFFDGVISNLSLQIPFFNFADPFGDSVPVKSISLVSALTSPLLGIESADPSLPLSQNRKIGLTGTLTFRNGNTFEIEGIWPIDGDDILVRAACKLTDVEFDNAWLPVSLPENIGAEVRFHISKEQKSLDRISFDCTLENWSIIDNFFTLQNIHFNIDVLRPGILNVLSANFEASAKIGSGNGLSLISTGNYPTGDFYLGLDPSTPININDLATSFLGTSPGLPPGLAITELSGQSNYHTKFIGLKAAISDDSTWEPGGGHGFSLKNIRLDVNGFPNDYTCNLFASFSVNYDNGNKRLDFEVGATYSDGWEFSAGYEGNVSLSDLGKAFGFTDIPAELNNFKFTGLDLYFNTRSGDKLLSGSGKYTFEDTEVDLDLRVNQTGTGAAKTTQFSGSFVYAQDVNDRDKDLSFTVEFIKAGPTFESKFTLIFAVAGVVIHLEGGITKGKTPAKNESFFSGETTGEDIKLSAMLADLLEGSRLALPQGFLPDITIRDIAVNYSKKGNTKDISLSAISNVDGTDIRFFFQRISGADSAFAFGLSTDLKDLSGMPMVGEQLKDVKLSNIGFTYTSREGEWDGEDYAKGLNMKGEISFSPRDSFSMVLAIPQEPAVEEEPGHGSPGPEGDDIILAGSTAPEPAPAEKWFKLGKKLGPLNVSALGFSYAEQNLTLLFRGGMSLAGLTVDLEGLGLSFNFPEFLKGKVSTPDFSLNGLGLGYNKPPVEISGMFLKTSSDPLAFSGAARLKAASFTITGIGDYTTIEGKPSLFIYALFDKPLGGPSFFFVTGLAAGFGYNRKVRIPEVEQVREFPLVSLALSQEKKELSDVLADLNREPAWILPSLGDYWLAIGIRFTSFKIVESFILLIVEMGNRLVFNILGLSILQWPKEGVTVIYIELAVKATFGPDSDVIAVDAIITPNSYIFSKDATLRGGFAFYTWVSGPHEGDFVLTVGGYHPRFKKPAHYPDVERLSLNWRFPDFPLTIKGEMYFALTPTAIMAGGRWEIAYDLGFLRAYVIIWADMLIQWAPFHYDLAAGIKIGIEANIKILFIHISFKLEIGAELHIWGPPFAGEIFVDWTIFSFTIPFGDHSEKLPQPWSWDEFRKAFLPLKGKKTEPITISISDGIIEETKNEEGEVLFTLVNPHKLRIVTDSAIPVTTMKLNNGGNINELSGRSPVKLASSPNEVITYGDRQSELGIRPMGKSQLTSTLSLEVKLGDGLVEMAARGLAKSFPEALWSTVPGPSTIEGQESDAVIKNVLNGAEFTPVHEEIPEGTPQFDLDGKYNEVSKELTWEYQTVYLGPSNESFRVSNTEVIRKSLKNRRVVKLRKGILNKALKIGDIDDTDINFELDQEWIDSLFNEPVIVQIGGMPQYPKEKGIAIG